MEGQTQSVEIQATVAQPETTQVTTALNTVAAPVVAEVPVAASQPQLLEMLSEDLRGEKALSSFKDINSLAKSYLHAQQLIGKRVTELSPDELREVHGKMGMPETPMGYELPAPDGDDTVAFYRNMAHELGLPKQAAETLYRKFIDHVSVKQAAENTQKEQQREVWATELKTEWGSAFGERIEYAKRGALALGGQEFLDHVANNPSLGDNPVILKALATAGMKLREIGGYGSTESRSFTLTPDMALAELEQLKSDPSFRNTVANKYTEGHKEAVAKMNALYEAAGYRPKSS